MHSQKILLTTDKFQFCYKISLFCPTLYSMVDPTFLRVLLGLLQCLSGFHIVLFIHLIIFNIFNVEHRYFSNGYLKSMTKAPKIQETNKETPVKTNKLHSDVFYRYTLSYKLIIGGPTCLTTYNCVPYFSINSS